jgi:hypothetical protein
MAGRRTINQPPCEKSFRHVWRNLGHAVSPRSGVRCARSGKLPYIVPTVGAGGDRASSVRIGRQSTNPAVTARGYSRNRKIQSTESFMSSNRRSSVRSPRRLRERSGKLPCIVLTVGAGGDRASGGAYIREGILSTILRRRTSDRGHRPRLQSIHRRLEPPIFNPFSTALTSEHRERLSGRGQGLQG